MQKQTSVYIPKPCHEDWNKMTPTQQGKFCSNCSKQVIDFSLMSDNQVLNILSHQSGKLCGRFDAEQLQRPLVKTKIKKKKSWWMALTMPLLFLFDRSEAQERNVVGDTTYNVCDPGKIVGKLRVEENPKDIIIITGSTLRRHEEIDITSVQKNKTTIKGKVVNENNNPLAYASVILKGTTQGTATDGLGNFSINIKSYNDSATLIASYVGYETVEKKIQLTNENTIALTMKMSECVTAGLVEVVVGRIKPYEPIKAIDTIRTSIKKLINISTFKIYPNPLIKGGTIHLEIKQAGKYQLQLFDNKSRLITVENINTSGNKSVSNFTLPSNISSGIYYLRLINEQTKKTYTEKLIIQ